MKKILFVSTTLGNGGAERIISYLLNEFAKDQNKQIILLLLKKEGNTYLSYVSANVKVINLKYKKQNTLFNILHHKTDYFYTS